MNSDNQRNRWLLVVPGWAWQILGSLWLRTLRFRHWLTCWGKPWPGRRARFKGPFLHGVNLPWFSYGNDFGANAWSPGGGIAAGKGAERLNDIFFRLAGEGINCVRWFLFADGRAGIRSDEKGAPLGLDERIFVDLDLALVAAESYRIKILFVLFDFHLCAPERTGNGVQLGGRSDWLVNRASRRALRKKILEPLLLRYGRNPAVLGWDIFNEPEWITFGLGGREALASLFPWQIRRFIAGTARQIHRYTGHKATVGLASAQGLPLVRGVGLDLFQVHWYDRFDAATPLDSPVRRLKLNRPVLLGEFPTRGSTRSPEDIVETARRNGYCGALAWSLLAADSVSGIQLSGKANMNSEPE